MKKIWHLIKPPPSNPLSQMRSPLDYQPMCGDKKATCFTFFKSKATCQNCRKNRRNK